MSPLDYETVAYNCSRSPVSLSPGTRLGAYEIAAQIGKGGMGEVYRARDTKLGRDVAIKALPEAVAREQERLVRFEREGRTLAALNHPNIAIIHGLEDINNVRALVMELVEGPTLADRIVRGPVPPAEALSIARQIVDALDAAHERGIVHRDLKPANIKITPEGVVKVLDFGLAKAADELVHPDLTQSPTITGVNTRDGVILGTAAYMSPEQARGSVVDKRTDIWAFGCVLYEMLAGRATFGRDTLSDTIVSILDRDPDWTALPPGTPASLRSLMRRCLEKDQKRRLRDIGDARSDLDAPVAAETDPPATPGARRGPVLPWAVAAASLLALAATSWAWWSASRRPDPSGAPTFSRIVPITSGPAREFGPVLSPDGKWVAYVSNAGGSQNVWVKFLAGGEPQNLTAAAGLDVSGSSAIGGLEVSPDGSRIAVAARPRGSISAFATYEIPAPLPGAPRALLDPGFLAMRWSPDGTRMAFIRAGSTAGDAIWVADGDGTNRREIVPASGGMHMHWLSWSRDGFIYYIRPVMAGFNLAQTEIYRVAANGGSPEPVVTTLKRAMFPVPLADGGLIYSADTTSVELGMWWRDVGGTVRPLTFGLGDYAEPRVSGDGRVLVATRYENHQALMRIETSGPQAGRITPLTDGFGGDLDPNAALMTRRVVFSSMRTGTRHLWTANIDGSDVRPLTSGSAQDDRPALSPDGQTVAFVSDRGGQRGIWLIAAAGGSPRKLVDAQPVSNLSWSRDGTAIVYAASAGTWPGLWSVSVADGQVRQIATPGAVGEPVWSPTSDRIAYLEPSTTGPAFVGLSFIAPDGDPRSAKALKAPDISTGFSNGMVTWSPDGRRLAVTSQNTNVASSIWLADPDAAVPFRKLVDLPIGPRIRGITWASDGSLIMGQHDATSDIVLMDQGAPAN
jgi:eukaryotic-like serine/threonine-protein kinase